MKKETIADLCDKLRKSGELLDCSGMAQEWGFNCVKMSDCDACWKEVYDSIADRIEAAHEREMHELTNVINLANRIFCDGGVIRVTDRRREVVKRLKEYREHPPVRDVGGLIVEDTYSVGEIEGIVTGKELFTTGEFIDSLISLIDERKKPTAKTYTGLTVKMGKPAKTTDTESDTSDTESDTSDTESDTREKVEGSLAHLIVGVCAARLRTDETNMELVARFKRDFTRILDRQAAITERNCQVEYDEMCDYLQAVVDGLEGDTDGYRKKCAYLQGEVDHLNKALEAYRLANEALREQNMELRRTLDDLHERYANTDAVNGLVEHANDCLKVEVNRQKDALERCRLAYETVRGLFDGWEE